MYTIPDYVFSTPTSIVISGTTGCGKTTLLKKLLNTPSVFKTKFKRVVYCYGIWQDAFNDMKGIEFREGLDIPTDFNGDHTILILDDLMSEIVQSKEAEKLFTQGSHHKAITVIFLVQNLYQQGKTAKTIMLNTHYLILMRNARDVNQIKCLGRQIGLDKTLEEAYIDSTSVPYGYLLVDLSLSGARDLRLKTNIFPGETQVVYLAKNALSKV